MDLNPWMIANGKKRLTKLRIPELTHLRNSLEKELERYLNSPPTYQRVPEYIEAFRKAISRVDSEIDSRENPEHD